MEWDSHELPWYGKSVPWTSMVVSHEFFINKRKIFTESDAGNKRFSSACKIFTVPSISEYGIYCVPSSDSQ